MNKEIIKPTTIVGMLIAIVIMVWGYLQADILLPVVHWSISPVFVVLLVVASVYGSIPATIVGASAPFIVHMIDPNEWWLGWSIGSALIGYILGQSVNRPKLLAGHFSRYRFIRFNLIQTMSNITIWGVLIPPLYILFNGLSAADAFVQGWIDGFVNAVVIGVLGSLFLYMFAWFCKQR